MRPLSRWGPRVVRRVVPHSVRRRLRAPAIGSIVALLVALATTGFTYQLLSRAEAGADRYGGPTPVAVASHDMAAGHVVRDGDVQVTRLPRQAVPRAALAVAPVGRPLRVSIEEGQVVTRRQVADRGSSPIAAAVTSSRCCWSTQTPAPRSPSTTRRPCSPWTRTSPSSRSHPTSSPTSRR